MLNKITSLFDNYRDKNLIKTIKIIKTHLLI